MLYSPITDFEGKGHSLEKIPYFTYTAHRVNRKRKKDKTLNNLSTHLEKVILMHNTTVGQRLDQPVCQGSFAPISDPK